MPQLCRWRDLSCGDRARGLDGPERTASGGLSKLGEEWRGPGGLWRAERGPGEVST